MKKMMLFFVLLSMQVGAQTPSIQWWYDVNDMSFGNSAVADIDKDGFLEIVFSTYRNDSSVYALNAEDGSLLWKVNTGGCNDVAPLIIDTDLDGDLEVVLPSSCVAKTFCLDGATGAIEWETVTHGSDSPPTAGDVDGDGYPEILHGEFSGYVICINGEDGSVAWEILVDANCWIQTAPALADMDQDGHLDFVVGNWSFGTNHKLWAFRADNHDLLWESDIPEDVMYHGTSFGDLDKDGKLELAIGDYSGKLHVLNAEDGSHLWSYAFPSPTYAGAATSMADLDNDNFMEVIFFDWYKLGVISHTGTLKWSYDIPGNASSFRGAAVSDLNADGFMDVVFGSSQGEVIALHGATGTVLWIVDLAAHFGAGEFEIDHGPVVEDFDKDGELDIFLVGGHAEYPNIQNNYGRGYAITAGSPGGPIWPMFRRDIHRSACADNPFVVPTYAQDEKPAFRIFPNPASDIVYLQMNQPESGAKRVRLLTSTGIEKLNYTCEERQIIPLDVSNLLPGFYLLEMQTGSLNHQEKLLIE